MKPYRCLVFSIGQVGREACRILLRAGNEFVADYSRQSHVGEDLGELLRLAPVGVPVQASSRFHARRNLADIALFFTTSAMGVPLNEERACLEQGIDVLTIAEDALFPWTHYPPLVAELGAIARTGGATLVASGVNNVAMAQLLAVLGAFTCEVQRIEVECTGNFGHFGEELLKQLLLGLDPAGYDDWLQASPEQPQSASIAGQSLEALLAMTDQQAAGNKEINQKQTWTGSDLMLHTGQRLAAGTTPGITEIARVRSCVGVALEIRLVGKVFEPADEEYLKVDIVADQPIKRSACYLPFARRAGHGGSGVEPCLRCVGGRSRSVVDRPLALRSLASAGTAISKKKLR